MKDVNFHPDVLLDRGKNKLKRELLLVLAVVVLLMIGLYLSLHILDTINKNDFLVVSKELEEYKSTREYQATIDSMESKLRAIEKASTDIDSISINYYDLMVKVKNIIPPGIVFLEQDYKEGQMTIKGTAVSENDLADFAANLYRVKGVSGIWIDSTHYTDRINYTLSFDYVKGGADSESQ